MARRLTSSLIEATKANGRELYTCTVVPNTAMQKVFAKTKMKRLHSNPSLLGRPAASSKTPQPQPILQALGADLHRMPLVAMLSLRSFVTTRSRVPSPRGFAPSRLRQPPPCKELFGRHVRRREDSIYGTILFDRPFLLTVNWIRLRQHCR